MDYYMNKLVDIPNYPNYKVNRKGQIWSDYYGGKYLKPTPHKKGYVLVYLKDKDGKRRTVQVHRAVAMAFIPNPHNHPEVHHINAIRDDNNIYNLAWVSACENLKERHERNRRKKNDRGRKKV